MENYSTNREQAGLQYAHNPTDSPPNGEIEEQSADVNRDYGFALPSTDNNIQVRYVDRRNDPSSRPYWLLIDNTVPKYDPLHGLRKKHRTTEAVANPNVSTPLTLAAVQDGATGPASHTSGIVADGTDSAAYDASNDEEAANLNIAADVTGGSSAVATDGSENTSISDTEKEKSFDPNGSIAATTESRETSEPDEDVFDTMATPPTPRPGTARANRLARAAARQATLARLNTGANVVVSAEAEQIAQQAQIFHNYNVNEDVALVRINQDLGLRVRNPSLTHAPVADDNVNDVEASQDSHGKSTQNLATADEALVKSGKRKPKSTRDRRFGCNECPSRFVRREHAERHMKSVHRGEKSHVCEFCGGLFSRKDNLKQHVQKHLEQHYQEAESGTMEQADGSSFNEAVLAQQAQMQQNHKRLSDTGRL